MQIENIPDDCSCAWNLHCITFDKSILKMSQENTLAQQNQMSFVNLAFDTFMENEKCELLIVNYLSCG